MAGARHGMCYMAVLGLIDLNEYIKDIRGAATWVFLKDFYHYGSDFVFLPE